MRFRPRFRLTFEVLGDTFGILGGGSMQAWLMEYATNYSEAGCRELME